jgi:hypothetical protein
MNGPSNAIQIGPQMVLHVGQTSTPLHIEGNGICTVHVRHGEISIVVQDNEAYVSVTNPSGERSVAISWDVAKGTT